MHQSASSSPESSRGRTRSRRWLEFGFYLAAIACVVIYAVQWVRHKGSSQPTGPTGKVSAKLEPASRIDLPTGAAAGCNLLVITIDTLRADHLGCYGNSGISTPVIDSLAQDGVLFANAFTTSPSTLPGHSSIFTGLYPYRHGARANGTYHLGPDNTTLAEILKEQGYTTGAFIGAYVLDSRFGLDQGFDTYDDDLSKGVKYGSHMFRERPAQYVNEAALKWLKSVTDQKFFAWVHYFDPHAPYLPPQPLRTEYSHSLYDGEIANVDRAIGMLLAELAKLGVMNNTLVVLAADHGEGLGEHGEKTHSLLVYDSTLHTPLIFHPPASKAASLGNVVHRQVSNVDIVPTILDLLGIPSEVSFDGVSLLRPPEAHSPTIYAETISTLVLHGWSPLFTVRRQDTKYIHAPRPEVYDLEHDPKELVNLFSERPEQAAALSQVLKGHIGEDTFGADALAQRVQMDQETRKRMAALGYVGSLNAEQIDPAQASTRDPKDMVPHWERVQHAELRKALGHFSEAVAELEACLELVPEDAWTTRLLASAYLEKGDLDRAEEMAQRAMKLDKNEPNLYLMLGRIHLLRHNFAEAQEQINQALEVDPNFASAYVMLGTLYARSVGADKALEYYNRAIDMDPGTTGPSAYNAIAQMYFAQLRLNEARNAFNKALEIDPLNGPAHSGLASILIEEGDLDQAQKELAIAVRFMPNNLNVLSTLSGLYNKRQEYDQAIKLAQRALDINPNFLMARNALGSARLSTGDLPGAKAAFDKALEKNPRYLPCMLNLGQVHLAQGEEEKAAEIYKRVLDINPKQSLALFNLGTYKVSRGRTDEALGLYRRALQVTPDYALAHRHLGYLLMTKNQNDQALEHLERSLQLEPDQQDREHLLELVQRLRTSSQRGSSPPAESEASVPQ